MLSATNVAGLRIPRRSSRCYTFAQLPGNPDGYALNLFSRFLVTPGTITALCTAAAPRTTPA